MVAILQLSLLSDDDVWCKYLSTSSATYHMNVLGYTSNDNTYIRTDKNKQTLHWIQLDTIGYNQIHHQTTTATKKRDIICFMVKPKIVNKSIIYTECRLNTWVTWNVSQLDVQRSRYLVSEKDIREDSLSSLRDQTFALSIRSFERILDSLDIIRLPYGALFIWICVFMN